MTVVCGNEQLLVLARKSPKRSCVRIDKGPDDRREGRLCGPLLASYCEDRKGTLPAERGEEPSDRENKIVLCPDIQELPQIANRATEDGLGEGLHASSPAKPYGRPINDPPSHRVDLHGPPRGIAEVKIDFAFRFADSEMGSPLRRLKRPALRSRPSRSASHPSLALLRFANRTVGKAKLESLLSELARFRGDS